MNAVIARSPKHLTARLRLAEVLCSRRKTTAAEAQLRECLALAPDSAEVHHALGMLLGDWPGREAEAATLFRRATDLEPDNIAFAAAIEAE